MIAMRGSARRALVGSVGALLAAGCDQVFGLDLPDAGVAVDAPADGGDGRDAPAADAPGGTACFRDEFEQGLGAWTEARQGCVLAGCVPVTTGDRLGLRFTSGGQLSVATTSTFDLYDRAVTVDAIGWDTRPASASAILRVETADATNLMMSLTSASDGRQTLVARAAFLNGTTVETPVEYDPIAHRVWRIRHSVAEGRIIFEVRSTGGLFTPIGSAIVTSGLETVAPSMEAKVGLAGAAVPRTFSFDSFEVCAP